MTLSKHKVQLNFFLSLKYLKKNFKFYFIIVTDAKTSAVLKLSNNFFWFYKVLCTFKFPIQNLSTTCFLNNFLKFYIKKHKNYLKFAPLNIEKVSNFQWNSIYLKSLLRHSGNFFLKKQDQLSLFMFILAKLYHILLFNFFLKIEIVEGNNKLVGGYAAGFNPRGDRTCVVHTFYKNNYKTFFLKERDHYKKNDNVELMYYKLNLLRLKKFKGVSLSKKSKIGLEPESSLVILNKPLLHFLKNKTLNLNVLAAHIKNRSLIFYDTSSRLFFDNKNMLKHLQSVIQKLSIYSKFFFYKKNETLLLKQNELLLLNNKRNNYIDWKTKEFSAANLIFFNRVRLTYKKKIRQLLHKHILVNFEFLKLFEDKDVDTCYLPNNIRVRKLIYNKNLYKFIYFRRAQHFIKYLQSLNLTEENDYLYQIWKKATEFKNLMHIWLQFRKKSYLQYTQEKKKAPVFNVYDDSLLKVFRKLNSKHCYIPKTIKYTDIYAYTPKFLINSPKKNVAHLLRGKLLRSKDRLKFERWYPSDELMKSFLIAKKSYSDKLKFNVVANLKLSKCVLSYNNPFAAEFIVNPVLLELYKNDDPYTCYIPEIITVFHIFMNIEAIEQTSHCIPTTLFRDILISRKVDENCRAKGFQKNDNRLYSEFEVPSYFSKWNRKQVIFNHNLFDYLDKNPNKINLISETLSIDLIFLDNFSRNFFKNFNLETLVKVILKKKYYLCEPYPEYCKKTNGVNRFIFQEIRKNIKLIDSSENVVLSPTTIKKKTSSVLKDVKVRNGKQAAVLHVKGSSQPLDYPHNINKNKLNSRHILNLNSADIQGSSSADVVKLKVKAEANVLRKNKIKLNIDRVRFYEILKKELIGQPLSFNDIKSFYKKIVKRDGRLFDLFVQHQKIKHTLKYEKTYRLDNDLPQLQKNITNDVAGYRVKDKVKLKLTLRKKTQSFSFLGINFNSVGASIFHDDLFSNVESNSNLIKKLFLFEDHMLNIKFLVKLTRFVKYIHNWLTLNFTELYAKNNSFILKIKSLLSFFSIIFFKEYAKLNKIRIESMALSFNFKNKKNTKYEFNANLSTSLQPKNHYTAKSRFLTSMLSLKKYSKQSFFFKFILKKLSKRMVVGEQRKFKLLGFFFNNVLTTDKSKNIRNLLKGNKRNDLKLKKLIRKNKMYAYNPYFKNNNKIFWQKKINKIKKNFFKKIKIVQSSKTDFIKALLTVFIKKSRYVRKVSICSEFSHIPNFIVYYSDPSVLCKNTEIRHNTSGFSLIKLRSIFYDALSRFSKINLLSFFNSTLSLNKNVTLLDTSLFNFSSYYSISKEQVKKALSWSFSFLYLIKPGFLDYISKLSSFLNSLFFFIKKQRLNNFFNKFWVDRGFFFPIELSLFKFFFLYYTNFFFNFFEVSTFLNFNNFYKKSHIEKKQFFNKTLYSNNPILKKKKPNVKFFKNKDKLFYKNIQKKKTLCRNKILFIEVLTNFFENTKKNITVFLKNKSSSSSSTFFNFLSVTDKSWYVRYFRKTRFMLKNINFSVSTSVFNNLSYSQNLVLLFFFLKKNNLKKESLNLFNTSHTYLNNIFTYYYKSFNFFKNFIFNASNLFFKKSKQLVKKFNFFFKTNEKQSSVFQKTATRFVNILQSSYLNNIKSLKFKKSVCFFKRRLWRSLRKKSVSFLKKKSKSRRRNLLKKTLSFFNVKSVYKSKFLSSKSSTNFLSSAYIKNDNQSIFNYSKLLLKQHKQKFSVQNFFLKNKMKDNSAGYSSLSESYFFKPQSLQKNKKLSKSNYIVKKKNIIFKMKPGYKVLWRQYRQEYKLITNLSYYRQRRLTNYFLNFKKSNGVAFLKNFEFSIFSILRRSTVFLDYTVSDVCFNLGMVFLNGKKVLNKLFQVYVGDRVQVILNYNYLLQFKWFFFFINLRKIRFLTKYVKYFFNIKNSCLILKKRLLGFSEKLFKKLLYLGNDVPNYLEIDFMIMLVVIVYDPFLFCEFDPILIFRVPFLSLRLYNWKYVN